MQADARRRQGQAAQQGIEVAEIQHAVAPLRGFQRGEDMVFDGVDQVGVQFVAIPRHAKGTGAGEAAGAAGDLADFLGGQMAGMLAVELRQGGKGDMVDIHVQPHADGVCGDQEVDLALLEQGDLGVAGLGAERAHDHGRAAALATDQFGDGVDGLGRKGDDGRALGQAGQFFRAGIGQLGQAVAGDDLGLGEQPAEQGRKRGGAQEYGLMPAAGMQQAVGEDVAAFGIAAQLDFVDGQEVDLALQRHGLDRAHEVGWQARDDLFLASDQRDRIDALDGDHAFVDLARQQAQRQADHAGGVAAHAL